MLAVALQIIAAASQALVPLIVLLIQGNEAFVEFSGLYYVYSLVVFFSTLGFDVFLGRHRVPWTIACGFFLVTSTLATLFPFAVGIISHSWEMAVVIGLAAFSSALSSYAQYAAMNMSNSDLLRRLAHLKIVGVGVISAGAIFSLSPPSLFVAFAAVLLLTAVLSVAATAQRTNSMPEGQLDWNAIPRTLFMFANFSFAGILLSYERSLIASTTRPETAAIYLAFSTALSVLTYVGVGYERSQYGKDDLDWRKSVASMLRYVLPCTALAMCGAMALLYLGKSTFGSDQLLKFAICLGISMSLLAAVHVVIYFALAARIFLKFNDDQFRRMAWLNLLIGMTVFFLCSVFMQHLALPEELKPWYVLFTVWTSIIISDCVRFKRALGIERHSK